MGEEKPAEDEMLERQLDLFEESANVAGWSDKQHLYCSKVHLSGTALHAMHNIP